MIHHLKRLPLWVYLLVPFIAGIIVYLNTVSYGFVFDDAYFVDNPAFHQLSGLSVVFRTPYNANAAGGGLYRPIPMASIVLTYSIFGESPIPFHLTNILLHGILSALLCWLLLSVFRIDPTISLLISILFAVLPIHTEVVANIKSRDEIFAGIFFVAMWVSYFYGKKYWLAYVGSSIFFLGALLSKETAIVFPLVIILCSTFMEPRLWKEHFLSGLWFIPTVILYIFLHQSVVGSSLAFQQSFPYQSNPFIYLSISKRIFSALYVYGLYLEKIFVPISLSASYHMNHFIPITEPFHTIRWIPGAGLVIASGIICLYKLLKKNMSGVGLLIFLILYIPISQVFFAAGDAIAERWMYLPSFGLLLAVTTLSFDILRNKKIYLVVVFGLIILLYSGKTWSRNSVWQSNSSLFQSMIVDAPESYRGHELMAIEYMKAGDTQHMNEQTETAAKIFPESPVVKNLYKALQLMQTYQIITPPKGE